METANITVKVTTPQGMTANEALRLFTDSHSYDAYKKEDETRVQFARRIVAQFVGKSIRAQRNRENSVPDDVTVA